MSLISDAIEIAYPDLIKRSLSTGCWYWENLDGQRFDFLDFEEAAEDLAQDIGMNETEARAVIKAGKAVA